MSKLVLYFRQMENIHLKKDVGLFPIYLKRYFDEVEILYCPLKTFASLPDEYRGVKLIKLKTVEKYYNHMPFRIFQHLQIKRILVNYIKNNNVTHFMTFHYSIEHLDIINAVKRVIPRVKTYLKMDCSPKTINKITHNYSQRGFKGILLNNLVNNGIKNIDLITSETLQAFEPLNKCEKFAPKVWLAYNGYDDELYVKPEIAKKEKTIITVGRLGTAPKNTELFLEIIKKLDLKDWKIKLIGPIEKEEKDFQNVIDKFYVERPDLKGKVIFTGAINDSKKLLKEYQEASVFVLTSRHESSALVLMESAINGCYVLTTEVGIAKDLKYCYICPNSSQGIQNEEVMLNSFSSELQRLVDNQELCFENFDERNEFYKNHFLMSKIVNGEGFKKFSEKDFVKSK